MVAKLEPLLTVADVEAMPEDGNHYEIIDGELFVSRAPILTHQRVVANLLFHFRRWLEENPIGEIVVGPGITFSEFSAVIPDLVFISTQRRKAIASGDRITGAPDLVIEVLSPGAENEQRDKHAKRQLYRKYGVKEYWVADLARSTVEIYRTARLRLTATLRAGDDVTTALLRGFRCAVKDIFE